MDADSTEVRSRKGSDDACQSAQRSGCPLRKGWYGWACVMLSCLKLVNLIEMACDRREGRRNADDIGVGCRLSCIHIDAAKALPAECWAVVDGRCCSSFRPPHADLVLPKTNSIPSTARCVEVCWDSEFENPHEAQRLAETISRNLDIRKRSLQDPVPI